MKNMKDVKNVNKFSEIRYEVGTKVGICYATPNGNRLTIRSHGKDINGNIIYHLYMNQCDMEKIANTKASNVLSVSNLPPRSDAFVFAIFSISH